MNLKVKYPAFISLPTSKNGGGGSSPSYFLLVGQIIIVRIRSLISGYVSKLQGETISQV